VTLLVQEVEKQWEEEGEDLRENTSQECKNEHVE
jgi:hypothetical protein